jgi:hypothetical protein
MADNLLNSSISALATKIANDVASASIDELVDLARAAQSIGEDDNTTIETAINTRVNALYSSATPEQIKKLGDVVDKMTKIETVGGNITDISQLTDNTSLLGAGADLSAVDQHILPTTDDTYDLGSSSKKFRDVYLGASTLYLGDKQISSDVDGIVLPAGSKIGAVSIPTDVSDLTDTTNLLAGFSGNYVDLTNKPTLLTQSDIDISVSNLVDSAPATLNTLNELASALGDDPNFATTITNQIAAISATDSTLSVVQSGNLTVVTGTDKSYIPYAININKIVARVETAPTGSAIIIGLLKNGASINTSTISDGATKTTNNSLSLALVEDDYLTIDITQIGSTSSGADLTLTLYYTKT